ncbi:dihydrofolate reductase family protein [Nocardia goodfellowii]|uniref:Dihydrofolate reductase n=1 Tax=Nocardia goodfellowii TaxID=882446 RepID=A0ABS4QG97_9NOCA|nr:dihydrofolate reductase family protein [Nocardia goodfellowii]MBP2190175.1 dihydrofolate reductase [Nocardia goodfellowii]
MRKVIVQQFVSLDGVVQGPGSADEDREHGFAGGGWTARHAGDLLSDTFLAWTADDDALLLGRKTYDIFYAYWPTTGDHPINKRLEAMDKYVTSRSPRSPEWVNTTVLDGDVAGAVEALKEGTGGPIWVSGSGNLTHTLMRHGLVDEYRLLIFPVVVGSGKRLFVDGAIPTDFDLTSSRTVGNVIIATYQRCD